ncbi:MAG: hypothetical protein PF485_09125 [Bacteroidales bacterium]|nr:hypothetical protein [Bacteroidales bacterium]
MKKVNVVLLLKIVTIAFNRCSMPRYQAGRAYLAHSFNEQTNYGLYSYFLFSKRPESHQKERYIIFIESYLNSMEKIEDHEEYIGRDSLNICYMPINFELSDSIKQLDIKQKSEWILKNYDYARAKFFLNKIDQELLTGPYIISYKRPLSLVSAIDGKYLLQDLSNVHLRVVPLWIDEFLKQSSKAKYWDEEHLKNLTNDLRNTIAIAADGLQDVSESLQWWQESLNSWIALN